MKCHKISWDLRHFVWCYLVLTGDIASLMARETKKNIGLRLFNQNCTCWWPSTVMCYGICRHMVPVPHIYQTMALEMLTHWGRDKMAAILQTTLSNTFFFNENVLISAKISLKFVPTDPINNIPALVQIMAWRRPGDKPLSEPMMVRLPMHICVTQPQRANVLQAKWQQHRNHSLFHFIYHLIVA